MVPTSTVFSDSSCIRITAQMAGPQPWASSSVGLGWGMEMCISDRVLENASMAGPGAIPWGPVLCFYSYTYLQAHPLINSWNSDPLFDSYFSVFMTKYGERFGGHVLNYLWSAYLRSMERILSLADVILGAVTEFPSAQHCWFWKLYALGKYTCPCKRENTCCWDLNENEFNKALSRYSGLIGDSIDSIRLQIQDPEKTWRVSDPQI